MDLFCKPFEELTLQELYEIMRLRQEVFVVEQNCPYLDADGKDIDGLHCFGIEDGKIAAYTRLLPKAISYPEYCSIGRVITALTFRGKGYGKEIMIFSIEKCKTHFPNEPIKISAQSHLGKFYNELGFKATGENYLEDGIPHSAMTYTG